MFIFKLFLSLFSPFFFFNLKLDKNSKIVVLTLHEVDEKNWNKVSKLLKFLKRNFGFVTPQEFNLFLKNEKEASGVKFLLTFDDGFVSSADFGLKVLDELSISAVYFICPNFVELSYRDEEKVKDFVRDNLFLGKDGFFESYRKPFDWEVAKKLSAKGHLLTSHTLSHPVLKGLDEEKVELELKLAKDIIEEKLKVSADWFAFPFGGLGFIDPYGMKKIRNLYKCNFSGLRGVVTKRTNHYAIPRCSIDINSPFIMMVGEAMGVSNFLHKKKSRVLEKMINN